MPSSTSSSEGGIWRRTGFVSLALVIVLVGGWETLWRFTGFSPAINDDAARQLRSNQAQWRRWRGRPAEPDEITRASELVNGWLLKIHKRGGKVIFVRMPTSEAVRAREQRLFPRRQYGDVFTEQANALAIHFEDHPALQRFHPPDGSHLDRSERVDFSRALGRIIIHELKRRERS